MFQSVSDVLEFQNRYEAIKSALVEHHHKLLRSEQNQLADSLTELERVIHDRRHAGAIERTAGVEDLERKKAIWESKKNNNLLIKLWKVIAIKIINKIIDN
jgi:hypothetical protein